MLAERHIYGLDLIQLNPETTVAPPEIERVPWWPPGYSAAIALVSGMSASDPLRMVLAAHWLNIVGQLTAAAGLGVLAWLATRRRLAGMVVAGLYLLSGPLMSEGPRIISEHLFMPLVAWAAVLHLKALTSRHRGFVLGASVLWSAAALTRYPGAVLAGIAGLACLMVLWPRRDRWQRLGQAITPMIVCWSVLAAWLTRNIFLEGRITQPYAPGEVSLTTQAWEAVMAWLVGTCGIPVVPSVAPEVRSMSVSLGGFFLAVALLVISISLLRARSCEQPVEWRWLRSFCLIGIPLLLALLVFAAMRGRVNTLFGRLMMPTSALTILLLVTSAFRLRPTRLPVALVAVWLVTAGLLQGTTNLMVPDGREQLDGVVALARSPQVQTAARGQRLLLLPRGGIGPSPLMLQAGVFVPAATVYWIDNPLYSGIELGPDRVEDFVASGAVDGLLRGPSHPQVQFPPRGPGPERLRRHVYVQYIAGQQRELGNLQIHPGALSLPMKTVAEEGPWTIQQIQSANATGSMSATRRQR